MNERHRVFAMTILAAGVLGSGCSVQERPFAGGSGSGGGGDGGGGGGNSGGGDSACAKALACDDFEAQTVNDEPSGAFSSAVEAGTVVIDNSRSFSGKQSVKLSTGATDGFKAAMLNYSDPAKLPTTNNAVFGRMMFWLESAPETDLHWSFIVGLGIMPGDIYTVVYRYGGQHPVTKDGQPVGSQLMANYETPDSYDDPAVGPATNCYQLSNDQVVPVGKWTCAEFRLDGSTNEMQLWLDGVELPDLHVQGSGEGCISQAADYTWAAPSFTDVFVGWESYALDEPRTIWIDDLAIGTERLGCP